MKRRKAIPSQIESEVLIQSRRRCSLCFGLNKNQEEKSGQIAHIDQNSSNNSFSNLVFLCLNHHDAYDSRPSQSKGYTEIEIKHYREELYKTLGSSIKQLKEEKVRKWPKERQLSKATLEYIWDDIYQLVFGGTMSGDDIAAEVIEVNSIGHKKNEIIPYVITITQKLLEEHQKQQNNWSSITDCDRLDKAFEELERNGILSRQDFSDCTNCGYSEILDEIKKAEKKGRKIRGFTFYHWQDTWHAINGGNIFLGYGSTIDNDEASDLEIAREIIFTLSRHDLRTKWNNTINQRIEVYFEWRKRR
jgi:hypothetical protein